MRLSIREALVEAEEARWQCETCDAPAIEDEPHCLSCKIYWEDVRDGLFNEPWEPFVALETEQ